MLQKLRTLFSKVSKQGSMTSGGQALKWKTNHMFVGFLAALVISYLLLSTNYLGSEAAFMLIVFNFFFVSLTFPLNGLLAAKMLLLVLGNFIGLLWNYLFSLFAYAVAYYTLGFFNVLYLLLGPLGNMMWIVTFYSMSLTFLSTLRVGRQGRDFGS